MSRADRRYLVLRGETWWFRRKTPGKLHWFSLETRDLGEARRRRDRVNANIDAGRWGSNRRRTVNELIEMFASDHMPTLKPSSRQRYRVSAVHILDEFDQIPLVEIGPAQLKAFENRRRRDGVSAATIRRDLACLSSMMSLAEEEEWITGNPVRAFLRQRGKRGLTESPPKTRYLSHEEEQTVIADAPSDRARQLIVFAIDTGLRRAEQFQIRWRDVDLSERFITVRAELAKSAKSRRVPILDRTHRLLSLMFMSGPDPSAPVFARETGDPYSPRSPWVWEQLQKASTALDEHVSWHDLRRTCGCRLLNDYGLSMHDVSVWLGHSSVMVTERHYAFLKSERLRERVAARSTVVSVQKPRIIEDN